MRRSHSASAISKIRTKLITKPSSYTTDCQARNGGYLNTIG